MYKHKISICTIVKKETDLLEWISYHKVVGFDHIYIYNNDDQNLIKLKSNFCTFIEFPGENQQINAYKHFLKNYKKETEYICVIDADEYVVFNEKFSSIKEIIEIFPKDLDSIALNWKMFVNNSDTRSNLVLENKTWQKNIFKNKDEIKILNFHKGIKTLSKTDVIDDIDDPHYFLYNKDPIIYCGDLINKKQIESRVHYKNQLFYLESDPILWINHYYIKSRPEFMYKCEYKGNGMGVVKNYKNELSKFGNNLCEEPTNILNYKNKVLQEMENI